MKLTRKSADSATSGGVVGDADAGQVTDRGRVVDDGHRHDVEVEDAGRPQLGHQVAEAGDHAELALLEPLERRGFSASWSAVSGQLGVAQQRQHLLQRRPGVVGGEGQRGRVLVVVEDLAAAGVDERRQPAQGRRDVEAGDLPARPAGVLGRGLELLEGPGRLLGEVLVVDGGHVEAALRHRLEVDELRVVVDDHRRDAVGHALQLAVAGERLERRPRVAVAEVDVALVEQVADAAG